MSETIQSIIEWSQQTFPSATLEGQLAKFKEEEQEWLESECCDMAELADQFIVAVSMGRFDAVESAIHLRTVITTCFNHDIPMDVLQIAIDEKMAINKSRTWEKRDGQYKHKGE